MNPYQKPTNAESPHEHRPTMAGAPRRPSMMSPIANRPKPWSRRARRRTRLDPRRGKRLDHGPNLSRRPRRPGGRLLEQFENFPVIIPLVATVISVIEWLLQDPRESALPYEAIVILAIVVLNAMLGFIQR